MFAATRMLAAMAAVAGSAAAADPPDTSNMNRRRDQALGRGRLRGAGLRGRGLGRTGGRSEEHAGSQVRRYGMKANHYEGKVEVAGYAVQEKFPTTASGSAF